MGININLLEKTVQEIAIKGKGILAADESMATIKKRFDAIGVENSEENRKNYRELLFTTPNINQFISGVILFEETLYQKTHNNKTFPQILSEQGIIPGIKVDKGFIPLTNFEGDKITEGLDNLAIRLTEYKKQGARFAKWRSVFPITNKNPSRVAVKTNAEVLARYAVICQENGVVPIVEPEILIDGDHTILQCAKVSLDVLHGVFHALHRHKIFLEGMILKASMVLPGNKCPNQTTVNEVAEKTLQILRETVPAAVQTINFLSGGQTSELATAHLNAINSSKTVKPWNLSFSYARALQNNALKSWAGKKENIVKAQEALLKRAKLNSAAALGNYNFKDE